MKPGNSARDEQFTTIKSKILSRDGRCDSPGHNVNYLNYSLYDQDSKKILASSLTQVTDVGGCSN